MKIKMSNMVYLGILGFALTFVGCASDTGASVDASSSATLEIATPSGWTRQNNYPVGAGLTADFVLFGQRSDNFSPNILVITNPASGMSISDAMQAEIDVLRSQAAVSNLVVDSSEIISFHGQQAALLQIQYTMSGYNIFAREILFVYDGSDCQIILTRLQSDEASASIFATAEQSVVLQ